MGLRKNVRNWLFIGIRASSISAISMDTITAAGTEMAEKIAVFLTAILNAPLFHTAM